ncbi:MAG: hypothetical protein ACFCUP_03375 [Actinomycetales bacterium]
MTTSSTPPTDSVPAPNRTDTHARALGDDGDDGDDAVTGVVGDEPVPSDTTAGLPEDLRWHAGIALGRIEIPRPPRASGSRTRASTVAILIETTIHPSVVRLWLSSPELPVAVLLPLARMLRTAAARAGHLSANTAYPVDPRGRGGGGGGGGS